jgi:hypothetical protein
LLLWSCSSHCFGCNDLGPAGTRLTHDALKRYVLVVYTLEDKQWGRFSDANALRLRQYLQLNKEVRALEVEQLELRRQQSRFGVQARHFIEAFLFDLWWVSFSLIPNDDRFVEPNTAAVLPDPETGRLSRREFVCFKVDRMLCRSHVPVNV